MGTWRQNVGAGQDWAPAQPLLFCSHARVLLFLLTHMTAVAQHACRVLPPWRSSDKPCVHGTLPRPCTVSISGAAVSKHWAS